jgi:hypothetical protein
LIMARPDLSLSDWPKRPRCSPPPVTTLRTPLKLVFRKGPAGERRLLRFVAIDLILAEGLVAVRVAGIRES